MYSDVVHGVEQFQQILINRNDNLFLNVGHDDKHVYRKAAYIILVRIIYHLRQSSFRLRFTRLKSSIETRFEATRFPI